MGVQENGRFIQKHMALVTALLGSGKYQDAIAAAGRGYELRTAAPGRIFCLFFKCLAMLFGDSPPARLLEGLDQVTKLREETGAFSAQGWDWEPTRERLGQLLAGLATRRRLAVSDLLDYFDGVLVVDEFRRRWVSADAWAGH